MRRFGEKEKNKIFLLLWTATISLIFVTIFSLATSFLYEKGYIGFDSDLFLAMGKLAKDGLTPYLDFFDHKGPLIIFVQCLGYMLGGKTGVFAIQVIFLTITLLGIYKICRLYLTEKASFGVAVCGLLILNMYYDKGNLTEEFCLPFLAWSTYFALKKTPTIWKGIRIDYLLYGVTFMVGALTRLTNSLPVTFIVIIGLLTSVKIKQWKNLFVDLWWFLVGNLVVLVPNLIYFIKVGALKKMIYATFIYNFKHGFEKNAVTSSDIVNMAVLSVPLVVVLVTGIIAITNKTLKKEGLITIIHSAIAILLTMISRPYPHYLMVWLPTIVLGIVLLIGRINRKTVVWFALCGLIVVSTSVKMVTTAQHIYKVTHAITGQAFDAQSKEIVSEIPAEDRDKVLAYNVRPRFYLVTDILPCYKNFALQEIHIRMDDVERLEFQKDLTSLEAKYIVTTTSEDLYSQWIEENYKLEKRTKRFRLFVRK